MRGPTGCCAHHSRSPSNYWCYVTHYIPTFFLGLKFVNHDLTQYCLYIYFMEAHNNIFLWSLHLYHNLFFLATTINIAFLHPFLFFIKIKKYYTLFFLWELLHIIKIIYNKNTFKFLEILGNWVLIWVIC